MLINTLTVRRNSTGEIMCLLVDTTYPVGNIVVVAVPEGCVLYTVIDNSLSTSKGTIPSYVLENVTTGVRSIGVLTPLYPYHTISVRLQCSKIEVIIYTNVRDLNIGDMIAFESPKPGCLGELIVRVGEVTALSTRSKTTLHYMIGKVDMETYAAKRASSIQMATIYKTIKRHKDQMAATMVRNEIELQRLYREHDMAKGI